MFPRYLLQAPWYIPALIPLSNFHSKQSYNKIKVFNCARWHSQHPPLMRAENDKSANIYLLDKLIKNMFSYPWSCSSILFKES